MMNKQFCKTCVDLEGTLLKLAKSDLFQATLSKEFGSPMAQTMRAMMLEGRFSGDSGDDLHDFLLDAIVNDSTTAWSGLINSGDEDWPINVQEYFGVFYVWSMEYDNVGYFLSKEDALSYVFSEGWDVRKA
jgi:hypothetical protein